MQGRIVCLFRDMDENVLNVRFRDKGPLPSIYLLWYVKYVHIYTYIYIVGVHNYITFQQRKIRPV